MVDNLMYKTYLEQGRMHGAGLLKPPYGIRRTVTGSRIRSGGRRRAVFQVQVVFVVVHGWLKPETNL